MSRESRDNLLRQLTERNNDLAAIGAIQPHVPGDPVEAQFLDLPLVVGPYPHPVPPDFNDPLDYEYMVRRWNGWEPTAWTMPTRATTSPHFTSRQQSSAGMSLANSGGVDFRHTQRAEPAYQLAKRQLGLGPDELPRAAAITVLGKNERSFQTIVTSPLMPITSEVETMAFGNVALTLTNAEIEPDAEKRTAVTRHALSIAKEAGFTASTELVKVKPAGPLKHVWASKNGWIPAESASEVALLGTNLAAWELDGPFLLKFGLWPLIGMNSWKLLRDALRLGKREPLTIYQHIGITVFKNIDHS